MDLSDNGSEWEEEVSCGGRSPSPGRIPSDGLGSTIKTCVDCGTSKTPLWRGGPAGPKVSDDSDNMTILMTRLHFRFQAIITILEEAFFYYYKWGTLFLLFDQQRRKHAYVSALQSLCNACGIRSRKKRRGLAGVTKEEKKCKKPLASSLKGGHQSSNSSISISIQSSTSSSAESAFRSWAFGGDVALQRPRSNIARRRKLGEEEQAAFLLLALSCGSVYA